MPQIAIPSGHVYAETDGDGPALMLVPGLGGRAQFWSEQVKALSARFKVILHDHRGVGRSGRGAPARSTAEMAEDAVALMDALNIEKAHYVGHSTGGAMGQHIALKHPGRLEKLVLSSSWPGPDALFVAQIQARKDVLVRAGAEAYLMFGTLLGTPAWHLQKEFAASQSFVADRLRDFAGVETECIRLDAVMAHDLRAQIKNIKTETLVIGARDDQITPPGFFDELAALIPDASKVILPEGGHFCPRTVPGIYNKHLLDFLTC
jgi:aminoacrylate hydrolase